MVVALDLQPMLEAKHWTVNLVLEGKELIVKYSFFLIS